MKFGIALPTGMEGLINPVPFFRPKDFLTMAQLAERLGFDSVWGNDHYAPQDYVRTAHKEIPNFYEVLTVLAAVAAVTTRVEIGTAVIVPPIRDVVTLARQVATLDQLSGGRFLLGVGIGAYKEEYEAARPDLAGRHRGRMLEEGVALLLKLFTEDSVTHAGEFYQTKDLDLRPKPARQPFPLLIGGHQQRGLDRVVKYGQGWIPGWRPFDELAEWIQRLRDTAAAAGRNPDEIAVAPQLSCLVAKTQEEAVTRYMNSGMVQHRVSLSYTGRDPMLAMQYNIVGCPEEVLEKLERLREMGVDHLSCLTLCVNSVPEYAEQLVLISEEVIQPYRKQHSIPEP